jgi:lysozyme
LNANQYGALVSFTYNSGCGGVQKYFESFMQQSNFAGICSALPTTNTLGGQLSSRRQQEGAFCSQASSAKSGCGGSGGGGNPPGTKIAVPAAAATPAF